MQRRFYTTIGTLGLMVLGIGSASVVDAATFQLLPEVSEVEVGQVINVFVRISPEGDAIDTARAIVQSDPAALEPTQAVLTGVLNRAAPGNVIDGAQGLISLGGFTPEDPMTREGAFATLTYTAKQSGSISLALSGESKLIEAGEEKHDTTNLPAFNLIIDPGEEEPTPEDVDTTEEETTEEDEAVSIPVLVVESSTHPSAFSWSQNPRAELSWSVEPASATVSAYYWDIDTASDTDPTTLVDASQTTLELDDLEEGVHIVHLKAELEDGTFTKTIHRRIQIDVTSPNTIVPVLNQDQITKGEQVELRFGTTDDLSGIDFYSVSINGGPYVPKTSPMIFKDFDPGTYAIAVGATDKAGNEIFGRASFRVYEPDEAPEKPVGEVDQRLTETIEEEEVDMRRAAGALVALLLIGFISSLFLRRKPNN